MTTNVRKMLDQIDEFLATAESEDAQALWDVLSALRGPDMSSSTELKLHTTTHIRAAAFPRVAAIEHMEAGFGTSETRWTPGTMDYNSNSHFAAHYAYAYWVLFMD